MKKVYKAFLVLIILLFSFITIYLFFPKQINRFPFFSLLFLGDIYLWQFLYKRFQTTSHAIKSFFWIIYWLPLGIVATFPLVRLTLLNDHHSRLLIILQGIAFSIYAAKLLPIIFLLIDDFVRTLIFTKNTIQNFLLRSRNRKFPPFPSRIKVFDNIGLIFGGILLILLLTGMFHWAHDFRVKEIHVNIHSLPDELDGFKIVQISDLHLGTWKNPRKLGEAVKIINDLSPDVIVFTGDLVNYNTYETRPFREILAGFKAEFGVFTILGNHDYGDYQKWPSEEAKVKNLTDLFSFYREIGWKLLKNNHAIIEKNNKKIAVIGVENWGLFARYPRYADIEKAKSGSENADLRILLSHDPSFWEEIIKNNYPEIELTFSGHTHGFQFGMENNWIRWSPVQYIYNYWAGLYENKLPNGRKQYLYVNRGLGNIAYPGRVGILPEITLIILKKEK